MQAIQYFSFEPCKDMSAGSIGWLIVSKIITVTEKYQQASRVYLKF